MARFLVLATGVVWLVLCLFPGDVQAVSVRAWEENVVIPTYKLGPDDVNPHFAQFEKTNIYPYTVQDNFGGTCEDVSYRALFLENEYLRVMFVPVLGGKLYSALDKTTGQEMFYRNPVVRPAHIAMRGAWTSGGVEWNAGPTGHTVTAFSPVDTTFTQNPDGSASVFIANTEQSQRTRWRVRVTLHPRSARLDEEISVTNPMDTIQTLYFWNNAAFPEKPGTRFIFPMSAGTDHGGKAFFSWPMDNGVDLSWVKNHKKPSSIFAVRCEYGFFGAYDAERDFGVVQTANPDVVLGKKAWTWGQMPDAIASQRALTNDDSRYIEIQSGPLPTQSDFGLLQPHESRTWQESWYPVHGFGEGYEFANRNVAFQTLRTSRDGTDRVEVRVLASQDFPHAFVTLRNGDHALIAARPSLAPNKLYVISATVPQGAPIRIDVADRKGEPLASYASPLVISKVEPSQEKHVTADTDLGAEGLYLKGVASERGLAPQKARGQYEEALKKDPTFTRALRALAVLDIEQGRYEEALARLGQALAEDPHDGWAWYYKGVTLAALDWAGLATNAEGRAAQLREARYAGHQAAQETETAGIGHDLIGRIAMRQGEFAAAETAFREALRREPSDAQAVKHVALALLAQGYTRDAFAIADAQFRLDPLDFTALCIGGAANNNLAKAVERIFATVGTGDLVFEETALFFADAGMLGLAADVLKAGLAAPNSSLATKPMPHYLLAYLEVSMNRDLDAFNRVCDTATALSPDYVFPSRPEMVPVLCAACGLSGFPMNKDFRSSGIRYEGARWRRSDNRAQLYLGNLLAGLDRYEEAVPQWEGALQREPALSVAARNLGMYWWKAKNDNVRAIDYYRKAVAARPSDQALVLDLATLLVARDQPDEAVAVMEMVHRAGPMHSDMAVLLANTYTKLKRYDDALALVTTTVFNVRESATEPWRAFSDAHIARGEERFARGDAAAALEDFTAARTYPENLGVGRPEKPQEARAQYWQGKALQALGRTDEARAVWKEGAEAAEGKDVQNKYRDECAKALAQTK